MFPETTLLLNANDDPFLPFYLNRIGKSNFLGGKKGDSNVRVRLALHQYLCNDDFHRGIQNPIDNTQRSSRQGGFSSQLRIRNAFIPSTHSERVSNAMIGHHSNGLVPWPPEILHGGLRSYFIAFPRILLPEPGTQKGNPQADSHPLRNR
jgi:hypothetical protein